MMAMLVTAVGIWVQALAGPDSPGRQAAMDSLVALGQAKPVAQAVFEHNWRIRDGLIGVLERMGAVAALAAIAQEHPKIDAQRLAIRSLGRMGQVDAQAPLRALLASEHRDLAVEALGRVGNASDVARVRLLLKDGRADVRRRAALALVQLSGDEAAEDLAGLLGDVHHSVRFAVMGPLASFGNVGGRAVLAVYDGLPPTGKHLALRLFGQLHYLPAQPILKDALAAQHWPVQLAAVRAIGLWGTSEWLPVLQKKEKEVFSPIVRLAIEETIKKLGRVQK